MPLGSDDPKLARMRRLVEEGWVKRGMMMPTVLFDELGGLVVAGLWNENKGTLVDRFARVTERAEFALELRDIRSGQWQAS